MEFQRDVYLKKLTMRRHNGLIKVITGARRAGKSYLLNELFYRWLLRSGVASAQVIRFAFDADEDIDQLDDYLVGEPTRLRQKNGTVLVNAKKFRAYIKERTNDREPFYLLLDEVQLLDQFVGTLNSLLRHRNFDIYVTGSNSRFLSSDIATEFKGRGTVIHVLPLSFAEYANGLNRSAETAWREYIETGGIPLVAQMASREEKADYLKSLCEETYLKDIVAKNGIRKSAELADTLDIVASMIGTQVNTLKIANTFASVTKKKLTDDTIAHFIDCFEDAFLVSKAQRYSIKGRKYIGSPFKLYFEDIGVRNARLNFRQIEESHLMENVIYNELRYRGFAVDVGEMTISERSDRTDVNGRPIYRQKSAEVDFVASLGNRKYYIQSALSMDREEKAAQEKRPLFHIDDSFQKVIITKNGLNPSRDERGVVVMDLFDFLLDVDSLDR